MERWFNKILLGLSEDILKELPDNCIDSIVTDPPYGLKFMGKKWDYDVPSIALWKEAYRVLKPGAHVLSFGGTRTYHRMVVNIEDAGFEIRDQILWIYGSGFPKSLDVSKAIDKHLGAKREVIGTVRRWGNAAGKGRAGQYANGYEEVPDGAEKYDSITVPATEAAIQWQGWGTALKPAVEPICLARKPLEGTVANNVLKWGTGGMNIDECRVDTGDDCKRKPSLVEISTPAGFGKGNAMGGNGHELGRFPANVILSYPEDEYELRDDVTPAQLMELARWLDENA